MKSILKIITIVALSTYVCSAQRITEKIDSILKSNSKKYPEIGISVGIIQQEKEYYASRGKLNKESTTTINENSIFEIASVTKALTANLIAIAINENKIKAHDYIDGYLPKVFQLHKNIANRLKISDLASHQSGLPDIDFGKLIALDPQQPVKSINLDTIVTMLNNCSELKDYGNYRYSTVGFILLGQILENIYNKSYEEIIQEKMFSPLAMNSTLTTFFDVKNRTQGYNPEGGLQEFFEWNVTAPAGLIKSNAKDMTKYLKAILDSNNPLGKSTNISEQTFYKNSEREVGLGVDIIRDSDQTIFAKTGDTMGQSSIMAYNRYENWGIIILINQRNSRLRNDLFNTIYEDVLK